MSEKQRVRGFEKIVKYDGIDIKMPKRQSKYSAGYDICTVDKLVIPPHKSIVFDTGVKAYMPDDEFLDLRIRSSKAIKENLMLKTCASVIDSDYYNNRENEGHIMGALFNYGDTEVVIPAGERIMQGIFVKFYTVDDDNATADRSGGIGSTDK